MSNRRVEEQDLDSILDDALEAFEQVPPVNRLGEDVEEAPLVDDQPPLQHSREENAPSPVADDDAGRALEDALRALGQLGVSNNSDDANSGDVTEADMKLVEEFITSLGESLSGLGTADFLGGTPTNTSSNGNANTSTSTGTGNGPGTSADIINRDASTSSSEATTNGTSTKRAGEQPIVEKLVDSIVGHLLSEDILKAPMLQMRAAYADWLPRNEEKLSTQDSRRFRRQQQLVEQICQHYENGGNVTEIMELLSHMEETGALPDEVMKQLSTAGAMEGFLERLGGGNVKK